MEQAPTMRLRPLVIALAGWAAVQSLSIAAETPAEPSGQDASHSPAQTEPGTSVARRSAYFAVMGEVARPGTYEAPESWTLGELVKKSGGVTPRANRTVRVFRRGVLTEQVYLGSGVDPALLPDDLVVIGLSRSETPRIVPIDPSRTANETATAFAVQIAFVNLIERPVIVKMPSDQATVSRIIELLGQSGELASKIRIFNSLGIGSNESESDEQATRTLESGTVLVFPGSAIRVASLPSLPAPIKIVPPVAPQVVAMRVPEFKPLEHKVADVHPVQHKVHLTIEDQESSLDISPHADVEPRPSAQKGTAIEGVVVRPSFAVQEGEAPSDPHPGRTVAVMAAMSAVAGAAMLLTIISIVQRWLQSGKPPFHKLLNRIGNSPRSSTAVISIPPISTGNIARRPLRIDAGQPITRLSVDLAAIERVAEKKVRR
jgi:SLBB domain